MTQIDRDTAILLEEAVGKYAAQARDLAATRARRNQLPGHDSQHLAAIAEQGWLAAFVPEDAGGMGLGVDAAALLAQGLAPAFALAPLDSCFLAIRVMTHAGVDAERLATICTGESAPALAFQETAGDVFDPQSCSTTCDAQGTLVGTKTFVVGHTSAATFIVLAQGPHGLVLAGVDAQADGVTVKTHWRADGTPIGTVEFQGASGDILCTDPHLVEDAIARGVDETNMVVASELMAHIDAMMAMTLEHLRTRVQFGKPIGAFQALQHRAVDLYLQQVLSRSVLDPAIARMAAGLAGEERRALVSRVRCRLNTTARLFARESIHLFGAMGITEECDLSLHVKRVLALTTWLGTTAQHRARFAQTLAPDPSAITDKEIPA